MYYPAGAEFFSSSESEDDFYPGPATAITSRGSGGNTGWTPSAIPWPNSGGGGGGGQNNNNYNRREDVKMDSPDLEKILERTKKSVRSILMAEKDQLDLSMLEGEYYDMYEETIPWRRLLFTSLEEFLRSIPSVCRVTKIGFSTFVSAVTDENTQHIRQMVAYTKKSKKKGKGKRGGGGGRGYPQQNYSYQAYRPPPPPTPSARGGAWLVDQAMKERTEKLIKSTLNTSRGPMSFPMLEKEYLKFYQEEIPWRRLGFSSLEKFLRSLPATCKISGFSVSLVSSPATAPATAKSSRPVPAAEKREEKAERRRLPETSELSVWVGRMRTFLALRKFGLLLSQAEKLYEKDWAESLPLDWRARLEETPDIIISDDGVTPPVIKLTSTQPAGGGEALAGQLGGMKISGNPR